MDKAIAEMSDSDDVNVNTVKKVAKKTGTGVSQKTDGVRSSGVARKSSGVASSGVARVVKKAEALRTEVSKNMTEVYSGQLLI